MQPTVVLATLHTDVTTLAWAYGLRNLQFNGPCIGLSGMPFDHARNSACMRMLEMGADFLFFLDSDVVPPRDTILRLMRHNLPVVSGLYCRRSPPHGIPVAIKDSKWLTEFQDNSLIEVDFLGAGCMLIRRDVLENYPPHRPSKHWFDWRVDLQGTPGIDQSTCLSEDFSFCQQLKRKMGISPVLDTSIKCRHLGFAEATLGNLQPLNSTSMT